MKVEVEMSCVGATTFQQRTLDGAVEFTMAHGEQGSATRFLTKQEVSDLSAFFLRVASQRPLGGVHFPGREPTAGEII